MEDTSKVYLYAPQVWTYCLQNREQLEKYIVCIAENTASDISVCLTREENVIMLQVWEGDTRLLHEEAILSEYDASFTVRKVYCQYIITAKTQDEETPQDEDGEERELELYDRMYHFLASVLDDNPSDFMGEDCDDAIAKLIELVCLTLAEDYGISVRRSRLVDTAGIQTREEYPYDKQAGLSGA